MIGVLVFGLLHLGVLVIGVAAAAVGLWVIAIVDAAAYIAVCMGLRALAPERRPVLTYQEIIVKQRETLPLAVSQPIKVQAVTAPEVQLVEIVSEDVSPASKDVPVAA